MYNTAKRKEYLRGILDEENTPSEPLELFKSWYEEADSAIKEDANAMILSTINKENKPNARVLLLRSFDREALYFFSNYQSNKAMDLEHKPYASLLFFWKELERQVRIQGIVKKIAAEESDIYFDSRPRTSQISALISPQSRIIPNRAYLETSFADALDTYKNKKISRPEFWGGYKLLPDYMEFWQGRVHRLHDRITYIRQGGSWIKKRLAP
jgi:pyridoxamine 5'-phosphate oxidase